MTAATGTVLEPVTGLPGVDGPVRRSGATRGVCALWRRLRFGSHHVVPCRDARGSSARLVIHQGITGVVISASAAGPIALTPRQVRRLRSALHNLERAELARGDETAAGR